MHMLLIMMQLTPRQLWPTLESKLVKGLFFADKLMVQVDMKRLRVKV